jgi:hypothetical protein
MSRMVEGAGGSSMNKDCDKLPLFDSPRR